jgi:ethanolamine utilization microcompartment shell protein EutL
MSNTIKDLAAGTAGGIAQVLVGQPFDIVKVVRVAIKSQQGYLNTHYDSPSAHANFGEGHLQWHAALRWRYLEK